ncbi:hypothetical protein BaRGS_00020840 [Batillaria attramentaria]|uniref:Uncharacterized protein n=1 Tax=Batillaria attramentaria TaxID=370345 RepID=A0ABD0KLE4_9CAEN
MLINLARAYQPTKTPRAEIPILHHQSAQATFTLQCIKVCHLAVKALSVLLHCSAARIKVHGLCGVRLVLAGCFELTQTRSDQFLLAYDKRSREEASG